MARLYTIEEVRLPLKERKASKSNLIGYSNRNHLIFRMVFHESSTPNYKDLLGWVEQQPRTGFGGSARADEFSCSITACYESYVWLSNHPESGIPRLIHWDVRVYTKRSAVYFRKVWTIPKLEYERNLAYQRKMDNQKQGHFIIDGKSYGLSQLMPIPEKPFQKEPRRISKSPLGEKLREFIRGMKLDPKGVPRRGRFWVHPLPPSNDFNREIIRPGTPEGIKKFPQGILGIRADDNFWAVAVLPYEFAALSIQQLVQVCWPSRAETALYHGDHDDAAYWAKWYEPRRKQEAQHRAKRPIRI